MHFLLSLPRAGSSLLASLLKQNPRFQAGMAHPTARMVAGLLREMSEPDAVSAFSNSDQRLRALQAVLEGFQADDCAHPLFIDSRRSWCQPLGPLVDRYPGSRMIACVRRLPWIIDSFERTLLVEDSLHHGSSTVYSRAYELLSSSGSVGHTCRALKQACSGPWGQHILLVQYETLTAQPAQVLEAVYDFLEEAPHSHDYSLVKPCSRATLLPPELFRSLDHGSFWLDTGYGSRHVRVV
jgi:sulfotransferase